MKKLILTAILLSMPGFAYENYMIISDLPVKSIVVENQEILSAKPIFTIDNSKKHIILYPHSQGKTNLSINLYDKKVNIDVKVEDDKIIIKEVKGFKHFAIDNPPKPYPIPEPPMLGGN